MPTIAQRLETVTAALEADLVATRLLLNKPAVVGIASGGVDATKLCGLTTAGGLIPVNTVVLLTFVIGGQDVQVLFKLKAGTTAESYPFRKRPYDYDAVTNALFWQMLGSPMLTGAPAMWNADSALFHYLVAGGAAGDVTLLPDQIGFALPA